MKIYFSYQMVIFLLFSIVFWQELDIFLLKN